MPSSTTPAMHGVAMSGSASMNRGASSSVDPPGGPVPTLLRVVQDDAERETRTAAQAAHPMAMRHAAGSARTAHRPLADRKDHRVALRQRYHLDPRLHAWPLLCHDEF